MQKLNLIKNKVNEIVGEKQLKSKPKIIVVSKKFSLDKIKLLLEDGHTHYGENQIQEAESKWSNTRNQYNNLQLHMIGKLQSNKAKKAVKLFDYIHSLDNEKLALKISQYEKELNKKTKLFIQINLGDESQKSGIFLKDAKNFSEYCVKDLSLTVIGLMCLPPINESSSNYFIMLREAGIKLNLPELSMGMSSDYEVATKFGSTYLRLGTAILGERNVTG